MRTLRGVLWGVGALVLAACQDAVGPTRTPAPRPSAGVGTSQAGDYIVVFTADVGDVPGLARRLAAVHGGELRFVYERAIRGFAVRGLPAGAAAAIAAVRGVAYVEPDAPATLFAEQASPPSWGLDRVDQADLPLNQLYVYNADGTGANVYIFDTGVRITHSDFRDAAGAGRAQYVPNGSNGDFVGDGHGSAEDCHGHGTHVAGTAAGRTYGVAKNARIWAARVVNCSGGGQASMLISALDWCVANCLKPGVVNMSLGYGDVQSIRDATRRVYDAGINTVSAAGNGNFFGIPQDACREAPAGEPTTNTVGSTTSADNESSFSNYGQCVDILAPGSSITSAWYTGDNATNTISGTSMATPHVAGAIALYLQGNPAATPATVSADLEANAVSNTITLHSSSRNNGTPNLFLQTAWISAGPPPPPPVAPAAPSGLSASAVSSSRIDLSWSDNSDNESGFKIERCEGAGCTGFAQIATVGAGVTMYSNTGLTASSVYRYRVRAHNAGGDSPYSNEAEATTPEAPPNVSPVARFTWTCSGGGGRTCDFDGRNSSDADGSISSYSWTFGDGTTGSGAQVRHRYSSRGTFTVTLTVRDNAAATGSRACAVRTGTSGNCVP